VKEGIGKAAPFGPSLRLRSCGGGFKSGARGAIEKMVGKGKGKSSMDGRPGTTKGMALWSGPQAELKGKVGGELGKRGTPVRRPIIARTTL